jgi:hypothetical protein
MLHVDYFLGFLDFRIALVDFLSLGLSRPEKINECDPVTRIRHECGFLIISHGWIAWQRQKFGKNVRINCLAEYEILNDVQPIDHQII